MSIQTADRFPRPVVCEWCGSRYRSAVPTFDDDDNYTQGDCCAAAVWQDEKTGAWLLQGFYGSTNYDTDRFRFVRNTPAQRADVVCDNCIGERICAGDIERIDGRFL